MKKLEIIGLLKALSMKTPDVALKSEIEVIIKQLETNDQDNDIDENNSSPDQKKRTAKKIADAVGKFFTNVGARIVADNFGDFINGSDGE